MKIVSKHHVIPSSRGGQKVVTLPDNFHESWHTCFQNMTPKEICIFVVKIQNLMMQRLGGEITWGEINGLINQIKGGDKND